MKNRPPLFSIITVCKNAERHLDSTITSLGQQIFTDYEYLVVDGNSTDKSTVVFEKYSAFIDKFVSESDAGIYFAMNKAVGLAEGEYVYFLNAGDEFFDSHVLETISKHVASRPCDVVYGDTLKVDPATRQDELQKHDHIDRLSLLSKTINHQAIFAKRLLFAEVGKFDTSFKIKADHDWILRCFNRSKRFGYVPTTIVKYSVDGYSIKHWDKFIKADRKRLLSKNYSVIGLFLIKVLSKAHIVPKRGYLRKLLNGIL